MEQKPTSSFAAAVMPGIYLGVALIVFRLILFLLDVEMESYLNWTIYVVLAIGLYLGIINFRDKHRGGLISYGNAFGAGFAIGLFASLIMGIFTYFFVEYIVVFCFNFCKKFMIDMLHCSCREHRGFIFEI